MDANKNGSDEEDRLFLERVLEKLYDFGNGSKKKKRKRKQCDEEEDEALPAADSSTDGCGEQAEKHTPAPTAPSVRQHQVEVVTFQDPTKRQRTRQQPEPDRTPTTTTTTTTTTTASSSSGQREDVTLEKARLEVHRFGITGYKKERQRVFEQDRAIMLGARPPKKQHTNYKVLQQQIKEKKQKSREEVDPDLKKKRKKKSQRDKKVSSGSGSAPTGQMGRFKDGMLLLSSEEIQKIKGKRGSR